MRMGLPCVLTTDNGSEFKNKLNAEMTKLLEIKQCLTTLYHPQVLKIIFCMFLYLFGPCVQSNGLDE